MPAAQTHVLLSHRLAAHGLADRDAATPLDVVSRLCAVQSQEYASALWAIGLRMRDGDPLAIDRAADEGQILRTHVLRPTWHFVAPADIRWMLALTGPRVHRLNASGYRDLELDAATLRRARRLVVTAIEQRGALTRAEIGALLEARGIPAAGQRLAHLVMHEELDGVICSGPRRGKSLTYALLAQRAPRAVTLPRDEALATLLRRYLAGHGPATLHDFAWWSGLTIAETRGAVELLGAEVERFDGRDFGLASAGPYVSMRGGAPPSGQRSGPDDAPRTPVAGRRVPRAWLLPNFDEYLVAYRDRSVSSGSTPPMAALANTVVIDGVRAGGWQRTTAAGSVAIAVTLEREIGAGAQRAIERAARDHGAFLGCDVRLSVRAPRPAGPMRRPAAGAGRATRR